MTKLLFKTIILLFVVGLTSTATGQRVFDKKIEKRAVSTASGFVSGYGITVLSFTQINSQLFEVSLTTQQVKGTQKVRVYLPPDYATSGNNRRYPVIYLLHGGYGNAATWTTYVPGQSIFGKEPAIIVMPNGDPFGFYTNWVVPGSAAPQNWRTYHMEQLVPLVDMNLRTVAKKQGRAIVGFSMGGLGAIRYAQQYPSNFSFVGGLSCPLDLLDPRVQQLIINLPGNGPTLIGPFGPASQALSSNPWATNNPITRAAALSTMRVALYVGNGDSLELMLHDTVYRMRDALNSAKVPVYLNDFGDGQSLGHGCNGKHDGSCMIGTLNNVLPRVMAVLEQKY